MEKTFKLLNQIQKFDYEIFLLSGKRKSIPKEQLQLEEEKAEKEKKLEEKRVNLEKFRTQRKEKEIELEGNLDKIKKYQTQLLLVKTNKEYSALLSEIESIKVANSKLEDEILITMEEIERFTKELTHEKEELNSYLVSFQKSKTELENEIKRVNEIYEQINKEREKLLQNLEDETLDIYKRIFRLRAGIAIVPIKNTVCGGCFITIPPQRINEVRKKDKILTCEGCGRILIWQEEN